MTDTNNTQAHTAGPWHVRMPIDTCVEAAGGRSICTTGGYASNATDEWVEENPANAERIVACVNALDGLNPDAIADVVSIVKRFIALPSGAWHPDRHAAEEMELAQDAAAVLLKLEEQS